MLLTICGNEWQLDEAVGDLWRCRYTAGHVIALAHVAFRPVRVPSRPSEAKVEKGAETVDGGGCFQSCTFRTCNLEAIRRCINYQTCHNADAPSGLSHLHLYICIYMYLDASHSILTHTLRTTDLNWYKRPQKHAEAL